MYMTNQESTRSHMRLADAINAVFRAKTHSDGSLIFNSSDAEAVHRIVDILSGVAMPAGTAQRPATTPPTVAPTEEEWAQLVGNTGAASVTEALKQV
jgi:hypothetical protein